MGTKVIDVTEYARTIVKIIKHIEHWNYQPSLSLTAEIFRGSNSKRMKEQQWTDLEGERRLGLD